MMIVSPLDKYPIGDPSAAKKRQMLTLICQAHAAQSRNGGRVPYWMHPQSVAETLGQALAESGEMDADLELLTDIYLAAQGHDLYEDTTVTPAQITAQFGSRVHEFIEQMTNRDGDGARDRYVAHVRNAPEEVRLIKLADLVDNTLSCAYGVHDLGPAWTRQFFLPILDEMASALGTTLFIRYPKAARFLFQALEFGRGRLYSNIAKFELSGEQGGV